jgi:hypothetical protein
MKGSIRKRGANSWELQIELERVGSKRRRRFVTVRVAKRTPSVSLPNCLHLLTTERCPMLRV